MTHIPHMGTLPTLANYREAQDRLRGRIHRTPMLSSRLLGERAGVSLHLKCENLQKTGSFKARGALNKLRQLDETKRRRGVVTVSAGNHAQALAWAARELDSPCAVVMPAGASAFKAAASRSYGAEVILHGSVVEAFERAHELESTRGLTFIHPFDDKDIVAGQGTVGLEILDQCPDVTAIVVPIGGGGQISGIAGAVKTSRPEIKVYGVEPTGACVMRKSLDAGHPVRVEHLDTVADGLAPPLVGDLNFELVRAHVEDVVLVSDEEILQALELILTRAKLVTEPSGAAAMAALLVGRIPVPTEAVVVAVLSGGNVAPAQLVQFLGGRSP